MEIETKVGDGFSTFVVQGRLDALSAPAAEAAVNIAIEGGASRLVLNMAGLEYISSAGLRVLLATAKKLMRQNGKLVLCALRQEVLEVFEISGLLGIFPVAATEAEAQALAIG